MLIHKEGWKLLTTLVSALVVLNLIVFFFALPFFILGIWMSVLLFSLVLQFFRNPNRDITDTDNAIVYAPADGKVVVIEKTNEPEYFQEDRMQVSIFMSPTNVHVNRNPIGGEVKYVKYHPGKYLVAWHPKSSTENERMTVVLDNGQQQVLIRQIAGAMARRIRNYLKTGMTVQQGSEMGFIKFGSRVDLYLPLDAKIEVEIDQKVKGNRTVIARL
jgi:phosphatidylserine decarboxylase